MRSIHHTNTMRVADNAVDARYDACRAGMIPIIESYIQSSNLFNDGDIFITFLKSGGASLVAKIVSGNHSYVIKTLITAAGSRNESLFFKAWTKAGVKTPRIFDEMVIGGFPTILMESIDAPLLSEGYSHEEKVKQGIYTEMGNIFRKMHEPRGSGYGGVINDVGEYETFKEWIRGEDMQKRIKYVKEHNLLPSVISLLPTVIETLIEHSIRENKSSYCHMDFGGNIFVTKPMTVFDPNPMFNNRYIDVGRAVTNAIAVGFYPTELVDGYFESEQKDERVLYAATFLNVIMKAPYSHQKGLSDRFEHWEKYLIENQACLGL